MRRRPGRGNVRHLFVTQDYGPDLGGMARRHVELCRRMAPDDVTVSTVGAPNAATFDRAEPYRIAREPFSFSAAKTIVTQLRWSRHITAHVRQGIDVIHVGNIRPCGYAIALATRRVAVPYLVYVNGGDLLKEREKAANPAKRALARDIFARAAGVVAVSDWTARLAHDVMAELGVAQTPPLITTDLGTDPAFYRPDRDVRALRDAWQLGDALVIATVARVVPHKGQDMVLQALAALGNAYQHVRYVVVGEGPDVARLRALAAQLNVASRVIFAGALSDEDVATVYALADVYVGLSRIERGIDAEGFGLAFVEASASGTAVLAGNTGGVANAVRNGETGFLVDPTDVMAVTAVLRTAFPTGWAARGRGEPRPCDA